LAWERFLKSFLERKDQIVSTLLPMAKPVKVFVWMPIPNHLGRFRFDKNGKSMKRLIFVSLKQLYLEIEFMNKSLRMWR